MVLWSNGSSHIIGSEQASFAMHEGEHASGNRSGCTGFILVDVAGFMGQDFIPGDGMRPDRSLIGHRARGDKARGLFAEDLRTPSLQLEHSGVISQDIIAKGGLHHGIPHGLGRLSHGIASKIDDSLGHSCIIERPSKRLTPRERPGGSTSRKGDESCVWRERVKAIQMPSP